LSFFVYDIQSDSTARRYVGQTNDIVRRLAEHNSPEHNQRKYTSKQKGPCTLVHQETVETRSDAMKRERWLKSGVGREWLDRHLGNTSPPGGGLTARL